MKYKIDYFDYDNKIFKYYPDVFKSDKFLVIKQNIVDFSFASKYIFHLHPNSPSNIISSEMELH